jgi:septum formation protein
MSPRHLILASASPYRRSLLDRLGVAYEAREHRVDERAALAGAPGSPGQQAQALARAKAESLAAEAPGAWILGSDQVAALAGEVLGKPGSEAAALAQLGRLAGREHWLHTAVALRAPDGTVHEHLESHRLRMRALPEDALRRYVAADRPFDCCGSYRIECRGIALFEQIEGGDFTAIVGLPLMAVTRLLGSAGFPVP